MQVRGARSPEEVDEAYELAARSFGPNYFESSELKAHVRELEPLHNLEDAVVVVDGRRVVGFVRILDRQYYSPAGVVNAGGITSVCIHPDLRGQGWGTRVMEQSLRRSLQRGDAFSILFARRAVDGWYPKLGYVGIGCHLQMQIEKPVKRSSYPKFTGGFQNGIDTSHAKLYAEAYSYSYCDLFLGVYRDGRWWETIESHLAYKVAPNDLVNVLVDGNLIGYWIHKEGRVIEAAALPTHRTEFVEGLLEFHAAGNGETLALSLPSSHWCMGLMRSMNHTLNVRYSWDGGHMVRVLDHAKFRDIVKCGADRQSQGDVNRLFERYDAADHEDARALLQAIVGATPKFHGRSNIGTPTIPAGSLLPMLPTWSVVDEL